MTYCLVILALAPKYIPKIVMGVSMVRVDLQNAIIAVERFVEPALFPEHISKIVMGADMVRVDLQNAIIAAERVIEPALFFERIAKIVVHDMVVGSDTERMFKERLAVFPVF